MSADDQDGDNDGDVGDEDDGNHCVRLAEQLRLTAESLAAFLSSVDRFFLTISFKFSLICPLPSYLQFRL